ncbi:uncharacterized protein RCO7_04182 [Rhynchosporium graminicola]|uniref:F-box domain-containing protein n=1 Tax=Rhynchosporium graminicola TaxID=2792576 RepID=A0A1E1KK94_9HELO|nr:uncharacterized protein RCO7_04182 [Rhynchosporium commune]
MGDWDCYCAVCGAPFYCFDPFSTENGDHIAGFDPELITTEKLAWVEDIRAIGFNPDAPGVSKCFITGLVKSQDYGSFSCELGDDPNVPPATEQGPPAKIRLTAYSSYDPDEPLAMVFHADCLKVLAQALKYKINGKCSPEPNLYILDKDVLYAAMCKKTDEGLRALTLDYGELSESVTEQYWGPQAGQEAWVSNPFTSPQITSFLETIKDQIFQPISDEPALDLASRKTPQITNPFSKLAKEITSEILLYLPYSTLQAISLSGLIPFSLRSLSSFWKRKLGLDMPFLWDLPDLSFPGNGFDVYHAMRRHCFATTPALQTGESHVPRIVGQRDRDLVLGLANRRRVWDVCMQLLEVYEEGIDELSGDNENGDIEEGILRGSLSLGVPLVAAPVGKDTKRLSMFLIERWADLGIEWEVKFYFEKIGGRLCGVERYGGRVFGEKTGDSLSVVVHEEVRISGLVLNVGGAEELWADAKVGVTGVKVLFHDGSNFEVGSDDGDKRLLTAGEGVVVTGLIGELSNGVIQRFGLLQCIRGTTLPTSQTTPPTLQRHLWKSSIPSPSLQASNYRTGYWTPVRSFDTIPMSALLLGTSPAELSRITGFSSDAKLRSFGVHFVDGSEVSIGPRDGNEEDRKVFKIDGSGGEVVSKIEVGMNHLPMAIKITTSHDRIAFFGTNQKNGHTTYEPPPSTHFIAGIYASWGYGTTRRNCTTISILTATKPESCSQQDMEIEGVDNGNPWSPPGFENVGPLEPRHEDIAVANVEDHEFFAGKWW